MFTWDPVNARSNAIKHGVTFEAVWDFAWERAVVVDRTRQGDGEPRRAPIRRLHGALHTIVFTERYGTCGNTGNANASSTYGNLWSDSNSVWRPVFCIENASKSPTTAGYSACRKFQIQPSWVNNCDSIAPQSPHAGVILVGLGDGSVRTLSEGLSAATWSQACDPRDGMPLGSDW